MNPNDTKPNDAQIPEEILRSEQKLAQPVASVPAGIFDLPGLPPHIIEFLVKYVPVVVLGMAVLRGFDVFGAVFLTTSSPDTQAMVGIILSLAVSVVGVLTYLWLRERRRLGWNVLALLLILQMGGSLLVAGSADILGSGIAVLLGAYIMSQLRDSYTK